MNATVFYSYHRRRDKVVVIMGATGPGKSRLSVDLATCFPLSEIIILSRSPSSSLPLTVTHPRPHERPPPSLSLFLPLFRSPRPSVSAPVFQSRFIPPFLPTLSHSLRVFLSSTPVPLHLRTKSKTQNEATFPSAPCGGSISS